LATQALGLIETVGLAAAIVAADAMVKTANVELAGYELALGGGMVLVKIRGDVGAVMASVSAGSAAASRVGKVVAAHVIPRFHHEAEPLVNSKETRGCTQAAETLITSKEKTISTNGEVPNLPAAVEETGMIVPFVENTVEAVDEKAAAVSPEKEVDRTDDGVPLAEVEEAPGDTGTGDHVCNLCRDPECPRRKGDPHVLCLHYGSRE